MVKICLKIPRIAPKTKILITCYEVRHLREIWTVLIIRGLIREIWDSAYKERGLQLFKG